MFVGANETDVRAEIAEPFLAALGYRRGTPNDLAREVSLAYSSEFLGRKKKTDAPLRGRADYVLSVLGAARWVLETKAPHEPIDKDAIDQAISYARHPEIAAAYAVVLNGVRLTVHDRSQASTEPPLVDLAVDEPNSLAKRLAGLLSPAAVRRDCSPPPVDLGTPLANGLRSRAVLRGGEICHEATTWQSHYALPSEKVAELNEACRRLGGLRIPITGGSVYRDDQSRIRAKLTWGAPHDELLRFALDKKLMDAEYLALDDEISTDAESPTVFDVIGDVVVHQGEKLFNLTTWDITQAGITMRMRYTGRGVGFISENVFQGAFSSQHYCEIPTLNVAILEMQTTGRFRIDVQAR